MKRLIVIFTGILICNITDGQTLTDAYRYSNNTYTGSARFAGMAGSLSALGGDFSSATTNPAGLGIYRTNDFMFTPSFNNNKTASSYLGISADENRFAFGISNVGIVTTFKNPNQSNERGIVSFNFAIGYNKLKDYNSNVITMGYNDHSSITDYFGARATGLYQGMNPSELTIPETGVFSPFNNKDWESVMAWNAFLIDTSGGKFYGPLFTGETVNQNRYLTTRGSLGEYVLSFAGNYDDKIFFGATLGIQDLYYKSISNYTEDAVSANTSGFKNMVYKQNLETFGSGVNLKIGLIYKPIHQVRFGLAFHTPTFFNLRDKYTYFMSSTYTSDYNYVNSPKGEYDYSLVTPSKLIGSVGGLLLDKIAFNFEYELVDYSIMRLRDGGDGYNFQNENKDISTVFGSSANFRGGLEYHEGPLFLRGGYAFYGSPYKSGYLNDKSNIQVFAFGFGVRTGTFYSDFAYNRTMSKNEYSIYGNEDVAKDRITQTQFIMTLGYKF